MIGFVLKNLFTKKKSVSGTRFVILSHPRSGSNLLVDYAVQHPGIAMVSELFNPKTVADNMGLPDLGTIPTRSIFMRNLFPRIFLNEFWCRMRAKFPNAAIGYKHLYSQLKPIVQIVRADAGIRKILLIRRNYVKQFLSLLSARENDAWVSTERANDCKKFFIDLDMMDKRVQKAKKNIQDSVDIFTQTGQGYLTIYYEDLCDPARQEMTLNTFAKFLGLPPFGIIRPQLVKQNPYTPRQMIQNLDEVEKYLRERGDEWMLDEA